MGLLLIAYCYLLHIAITYLLPIATYSLLLLYITIYHILYSNIQPVYPPSPPSPPFTQSLTDRGNLEVTENPGFLDDPPLPFSKSMGPTDFSPELFILILRDAARGASHFCPKK